MSAITKQSHLDKIYYESYNNKFSQSVHFNEFVSTKKRVYSQSSKYNGESLSCENTKLLSKQLEGQKTNETHGLILWTCKKCNGCIKYKQLAREHKIEDKFVDNPEVDRDTLCVIRVRLFKHTPTQMTKKIKYMIKTKNLDIDLLLYALDKDEIIYLVRGYHSLEPLFYLQERVTLDTAIDFFGPLSTKFLGKFYGSNKPKITGDGKCVCGKPEDVHHLVLTNAEEICSTMTTIPEYEYGFEKFKEM
ncbi:hypothetical protein LCGC14_2248340, partial [marine sediment metagenome]